MCIFHGFFFHFQRTNPETNLFLIASVNLNAEKYVEHLDSFCAFSPNNNIGPKRECEKVED